MVAILDANIVVGLLRNQREAPVKILDYLEIFIPITVVGELLFGTAISAKPDQNKKLVLAFLAKCKLIDQNIQVAEAYVLVRQHLQRKGMPIPENDVWIAAVALAIDVKLITRDHHFAHIDLIKVEFWK